MSWLNIERGQIGLILFRLNLTIANRIFILEPQWNPSIEIQAIARAQRMSQEQSVLVIRYIVLETVEEVRDIDDISTCSPLADRQTGHRETAERQVDHRKNGISSNRDQWSRMNNFDQTWHQSHKLTGQQTRLSHIASPACSACINKRPNT